MLNNRYTLHWNPGPIPVNKENIRDIMNVYYILEKVGIVY